MVPGAYAEMTVDDATLAELRYCSFIGTAQWVVVSPVLYLVWQCYAHSQYKVQNHASHKMAGLMLPIRPSL